MVFIKSELSKAIQLDIKNTEYIRRDLLNKKLLRTDLKIARDKKFSYLPLKKIPKGLDSSIIVEKEFIKRKINPKSYKKLVSIPERHIKKLPTSYDVIGEIVLLKLPKELENYKEEIGKSLLSINKNIRTVCLVEAVKGEFRTRNIEIIAGEKNTETVHTEFGASLKLDISKTFFSPRLATERKRIADLVKKDEVVVDMFTGVAPFPIIIAKYAKPKIVYAVDKNKDSIEFAQYNVKRNKVADKVEIIHGDAGNISNILLKKVKADRIIMNLPFSALYFFPSALKISSDTCFIHYYDFIKENEIKKRIIELENIAQEYDITTNICKVNKIKSYSPREFYIGIDIKVEK